MKSIIKKALTNKNARNKKALKAIALSASTPMEAWSLV